MKKLMFILFIPLIVIPSFLNADTIFFKDGTRLDLEKVWEETNQIKYVLYGSIISVPVEEVERVEKSKEDKKEQIIPSSIIKTIKNEIRKSLNMWGVLDITINDSIIIIRTEKSQLTRRIYTSMIGGGLYNIVYSATDDWPNIKEIKIINRSKTQGYCFEGGIKELIGLTETPMDNINKYILDKTHKILLKSNYNLSSKHLLTPFYRAVEGEYWVIMDLNIALMTMPTIPPNKQIFQKQVIILLGANSKIEVIKSKNRSWKEVFIINEQNERVLRGWILTSTVKSAYKL